MANSDASHQVLTVRQMQAAEQALMDAGTSVHTLMERAGKGAAEWIWRMSGGRAVTVLCGPGNNGGDGYVIARQLAERGNTVRVVAPLPPKTEAANTAAAKFTGQINQHPEKLGGEVFVDCLFGSGLSRPLSSEHAWIISRMQARHVHCVAVDVPSGVDADCGTWPAEIAPFDCTLALGAWKRAHWNGAASAKSGLLRLVDIGIEETGGLEAASPRPKLGRPAWDAHKYRRGLVAVVGGAMPGASILAAKAAMHAGAGYVKLLNERAAPMMLPDLVIDTEPLTAALVDPRISAVLVGPGLGRDHGARLRLIDVLDRNVPTVIDADALHVLDADLLEGRDFSRVVLTPHEGELAALCDRFGIASMSKLERAKALQAQTGAAVLAKGPDTILAHKEGVTYFPQGTPWLSVAGTGDVLAGIIASRLAGGIGSAQSASESVWLHHEAARHAGPAFSASDLARCVQSAYAAFQ